MKQMKTEIL